MNSERTATPLSNLNKFHNRSEFDNVGVTSFPDDRLLLQKTAGFGGITAVSIRNSGSQWSKMNNKFGSAWEVSNTPQLPWDFQFTSDSGQTVSLLLYFLPFWE